MNSSDPGDVFGKSLRAVLDQAMAELRHEDREAVLLRYFSGHSFADIGRLLRLSEEAARKRVDRALEKLRANLGRRGVVSTASVLAGALELHAAPALPPAIASAIATRGAAQLPAATAASTALLMSSTKAIAIAVGAFAVAAGFVLNDRAALRRIDAANASAAAELARAQARQAKLVADLAALRPELAEAAKATATTAAAPPANVAYLSDPEYRRLARDMNKARRHLEFQRLYRALNLTPDQIDRFEAIMVRQNDASLDAAIVRAEGGDVQTVFQRSGPEWNRAMNALLGSEGFAYLQDYLRSMSVRAFIDRFAVQAMAVGTALTPEQSDQLAALALANDPMYRQHKGTDPGMVDWSAVWDPAGKMLTSDQLALLQRSVEVWALQKQISLHFRSEPAHRD